MKSFFELTYFHYVLKLNQWKTCYFIITALMAPNHVNLTSNLKNLNSVTEKRMEKSLFNLLNKNDLGKFYIIFFNGH